MFISYIIKSLSYAYIIGVHDCVFWVFKRRGVFPNCEHLQSTIIAQKKEKLKSKEEFILIQKYESQEQMKKLQQQLKEKEDEIASIQVLYGKQHQV